MDLAGFEDVYLAWTALDGKASVHDGSGATEQYGNRVPLVKHAPAPVFFARREQIESFEICAAKNDSHAVLASLSAFVRCLLRAPYPDLIAVR